MAEEFTLNERVHSGNATELSLRAVFNDKAADYRDNIPTAERLMERMFADLDKKISELPANSEEQNKFIKNRADLHKYTEQMPDGFSIVPMMVGAKHEFEVIDAGYREFNKRVYRDFVKHLATNHSDELKAIGISPLFIGMMKLGYASEKYIRANADHIIERANSGDFAIKSEMDNNNPLAGRTSFVVNHFNNLVIIPDGVHEFKNTLKEVQLSLYGNDQPQFYAMLVPKENKNGTGMVAVPQSNKLYKVDKGNSEFENFIDMMNSEEKLHDGERGTYAIQKISEGLDDYRKGTTSSVSNLYINTVTMRRVLNSENMQNLCKQIESACISKKVVEKLSKSVAEARKYLEGKDHIKLDRDVLFNWKKKKDLPKIKGFKIS